MFNKALMVEVYIPESFDLIRNFRINTIIIGKNAAGVFRDITKIVPDAFYMCVEFFVIKLRYILLRKGRNLLYGVLDSVKVEIQVGCSRFTQHEQNIIGFFLIVYYA